MGLDSHRIGLLAKMYAHFEYMIYHDETLAFEVSITNAHFHVLSTYSNTYKLQSSSKIIL